jgi:cob(I)alamin adenosyltransferase
MNGLIHIYEGDGKGKTTSAVGLAVRFAGNGGRVLFAQFLKDDTSSELAVLEKIPGIDFAPSRKAFGFYRYMTEEKKQQAGAHYQAYFEDVARMARSGQYGLVVLDEIMAADTFGFVRHESLVRFLKEKPKELEVVMTGRNPAEDLKEMADYISRIEKVKHPYDRGVAARKGIEM